MKKITSFVKEIALDKSLIFYQLKQKYISQPNNTPSLNFKNSGL